MPPSWIVRLPQVVPWSGVSKVSPWINSMRSIGTSSSSATIWRSAVRDAGAEIDLAGIDGDVAGLVDGEEGIDFGERHRLGAGLRHALPTTGRPSEKLTTSAPEPRRASRREI